MGTGGCLGGIALGCPYIRIVLYIGEVLAGPKGRRQRAIGLVMRFGAGMLLSAVAYELAPETGFKDGWGIALICLVGTLT